jgi:Leucine-rich repeat (LRR) protein
LISLEGIENLINLKILLCCDNKITSFEEIENLVNLEKLYCHDNQLTSLEGIENLVNLKTLFCYDNQLTSLEGMENLVNLMKNNKILKNNIKYSFIDSDDFIELKNKFNNLNKCKNDDKINEYIEEIEQMIRKLNGFQKCVLK